MTSTSATTQPTPQEIDNKATNHTSLHRYDTVVFGSSLTKGLGEDKLSEGGKRFKVYSHGGARTKTLINDIKDVIQEGSLDVQYVSNVFLLCGGNDVENAYPDSDLTALMKSYNSLVESAKSSFPNAKINVFSLIPRRHVYDNHIERMYCVNNMLEEMCKAQNIRFVNIFSHFLQYSNRYRCSSMIVKLYRDDMLHFSDIGSSVLAKVLMGVVYRPRL